MTSIARHIALSLSVFAASLAAQDAVLKQLDASPRHHEWIDVASGSRKVHTFVAFPEVKEKALAILVLHENRGMTDWVRLVCDRLAAAGFIALAPDLLSDFDAQHKDTASFASGDEARKAIYALEKDRVLADLRAVQAHAATLPASNGRAACVGFCWGGAQAFAYAVAQPDLAAACVFYGSPPPAPQLASITAPVYGFYGENDQRINATIDATKATMKELGKVYEPEIYGGVGHAFLRMGDEKDPKPEVQKGCKAAWERLVSVLQRAAAAPAKKPDEGPRDEKEPSPSGSGRENGGKQDEQSPR